MATPTYTPIASITLGSSASSVTFSSIPQDYRDLVVVYEGEKGSGELVIQPNSSTTSSSFVTMFGNGSTTSSVSGSRAGFFLHGTPTGRALIITQVFDYSATDKHKTAIIRTNNQNDGVISLASRWPNTSAINALKVLNTSGSFQTGSTFSLFGIEA